jgi:hypothetical protein
MNGGTGRHTEGMCCKCNHLEDLRNTKEKSQNNFWVKIEVQDIPEKHED